MRHTCNLLHIIFIHLFVPRSLIHSFICCIDATYLVTPLAEISYNSAVFNESYTQANLWPTVYSC